MHMTARKLTASIMVVALTVAVMSIMATQQVSQAHAASTQDMYRLYNPNSGEHFYTASAGECNSLQDAGWNYEGIEWVAPVSSDTPVYRLYSGTDHHYTMDANERAALIGTGWSDEGIGWYSDDDKGVPLYRQFNPNVDPSAPTNNSGSHNYTTSEAEHWALVGLGWIAEDVGWYGVDAKPSGVDPRAQYDYSLEVLNPQGIYTGCDVVLYVKTSNPTDKFSIGCDTSEVSVITAAYYDDVHLKDTGNVRYQMQPLVSGSGYIATVRVAEPGAHELYVKERAKNADGSDSNGVYYRAGSPLSVDVIDFSPARERWMDEMIATYCSEPGMTRLEKMTALCVAFEGGTYAQGAGELKEKYPDARCFKDAALFTHDPNRDGTDLNLAAKVAPPFSNHVWNSYVSPAYLYRFAQKLGFTEVENLYYRHEQGTPEWEQEHSFIEVAYEGQTYQFGACPSVSTGQVDSIEYFDI